MKRLSLAVCAAVCILLSFPSCRTTQEAVTAKAAVTARTGHLHTDWLEADITYPAFEGYDKLNKAVSDYIEADYRDFKVLNQESYKALLAYHKSLDLEAETARFSYDVSPRLAEEAKRYISVVLLLWSYTGGAHGGTKLKSFLYDKETETLISSPAALGFSYAYLSEQCRAVLEAKLGRQNESAAEKADRKQWIELGTAPDEHNYAVFSYDGSTLTVYFGEYQVAPYSEGIIEVPVASPGK